MQRSQPGRIGHQISTRRAMKTPSLWLERSVMDIHATITTRRVRSRKLKTTTIKLSRNKPYEEVTPV